MTDPSIRPAFSSWPACNARLRDVVAGLTPEQAVIQRVFSHDVWHCAELNETLGPAGLPMVDLWD